jgi:hypothetical protein
MKELDGRGSPSRNALRPFSGKQKSNMEVTGSEGVPSCSCCLLRSEPPTWRVRKLESYGGEQTYITDGTLRSQLIEDIQHLLSDLLAGQGECVVNIKEHNCALGGAVLEGGVQLCHVCN